MREDIGSLRAAAQEYMKMTAQPPEEAEAEEEAEQPETDLVESEEEEVVGTEETEEVEDDEESEDQAELHEVKHNGEIQKVDYDELKKLASAGFDYTKKTQDLAEKVKVETDVKVREATADLDKKRQGLIETTELMEQFIGKPTVTAEQLKTMLDEGDTEGYLRVQEQEKQRQVLLDSVKAERVKVQQEQQAESQKLRDEYTRQQAEILLTKVPELKDEENRKSLIKYAHSVGYSEEELKHAADARALEVLDKARKWDEMVTKGVKPKPKSKSPKVTKKTGSTGIKSAKRSQTVKSRQAVFNKSNSTRDAGKLWDAMRSRK